MTTSAPAFRTFDNAGLAALLALTTVATATGIDGTLPLMPAIAAAFGADQAAVQLTLSSFMLGIAVGQLVHGPFSDRFGRKPALLVGLALNAAATAACALSTSIEMLMVFRFFHGIAASSGWLVARAVIRDRHERADAAWATHPMSSSPILGKARPGTATCSPAAWSAV